MSITLASRNATLTDLRDLLVDQQARKIDVVTPASRIKARDGLIVLSGNDQVITLDGVTSVNGTYRPTEIFDEGIADKLKIPLAYVRRLRAERPDLWDANVNGLLRGKAKLVDGQQQWLFAPDERKFLLRMFRGDNGEMGVGRAFLSDRFSIMDNLDVLTAALDGVREAGVDVEIDGCDLSDRRMYVRIKAPAVQALAPALLAGYRSPFTGDRGADNPIVFAGLQISNSETGGGAFQIVPRIIVQVCKNGMTMSKDAMRSVHLGSKMSEGIVQWSEDTEQKNLSLVTAKTRDAVRTFLSAEYVEAAVRGLEEKSGRPVEAGKIEEIKVVAKKLGFDQTQQDNVFAHFIKAGDLTAGGVMQAVTSAAQLEKDADKAADMEASAVQALELAFAL